MKFGYKPGIVRLKFSPRAFPYDSGLTRGLTRVLKPRLDYLIPKGANNQKNKNKKKVSPFGS